MVTDPHAFNCLVCLNLCIPMVSWPKHLLKGGWNMAVYVLVVAWNDYKNS